MTVSMHHRERMLAHLATQAQQLAASTLDTGTTLALLGITDTPLARLTAAALRKAGNAATTEHLFLLVHHGLARRTRVQGRPRLIPTKRGRALAETIAWPIASELGLHHVRAEQADFFVSAQCACGWHDRQALHQIGGGDRALRLNIARHLLIASAAETVVNAETG